MLLALQRGIMLLAARAKARNQSLGDACSSLEEKDGSTSQPPNAATIDNTELQFALASLSSEQRSSRPNLAQVGHAVDMAQPAADRSLPDDKKWLGRTTELSSFINGLGDPNGRLHDASDSQARRTGGILNRRQRAKTCQKPEFSEGALPPQDIGAGLFLNKDERVAENMRDVDNAISGTQVRPDSGAKAIVDGHIAGGTSHMAGNSQNGQGTSSFNTKCRHPQGSMSSMACTSYRDNGRASPMGFITAGRQKLSRKKASEGKALGRESPAPFQEAALLEQLQALTVAQAQQANALSLLAREIRDGFSEIKRQQAPESRNASNGGPLSWLNA